MRRVWIVATLLLLESVLAAPALLAKYYSNPVVDEDCPDPGVVYYNGTYYVATTTDYNSVPNKFPIRSSTDLVNWQLVGYIFPKGKAPVWSVEDYWAPEIHVIGGRFVVYFVARDTTGRLCVGVAQSTGNILGPYVDIGKPLIRNSTVGMIDPTYFYDDVTNSGYVFWKEDGNGRNPPEKYTPIWAQPVTSDGLKLIGSRSFILQNDPSSWEGILVEGPWVIKAYDSYYLFYSANMYATPLYAVGVAKSPAILGPYKKYPQNPIIHSDSHWSGPGHCAVVRFANETNPHDYFMMYHSWVAGHVNPGVSPRVLMLDQIIWEPHNDDMWPTVVSNVPSFGPTPLPFSQ